jgi:TolB protein
MYSLFYGILLLFSTPIYSLEVIEILGGKASEIPIAIVPFEGSGNISGQKAHQIISSDLNRTGLFRPLNIGGIFNPPSNDININYTKWSAMDAQFIVVGKVESENRNTGNIKITWSLIDIFKEKTVISMRYIGKKSQYRAIAHKVSDNVYEHLTGSKGVFHTKIAYVKKFNDKKYSLNVADFDGFNSKPILNTTQPIISPRWSPDGEKIAYVSFEKKKPVIYIQNLRTGKRTLLANFKGNNSAPAWSPDSRKLAIVLTYNKNSQIYIINADGSGIKQLMRSKSINTEPSWAPNGEDIYFSSNRGGSPQIYKVNIENDEITRVTYEGKYNLSPSISYDGKLLLFLTQDQGKFKVAIQNLISNQILKISEGPSDESPLFAPNGHLVLFAYKDYGKTTKIGTVSINGLKRVPISVGNSIIQEPTWGPINN